MKKSKRLKPSPIVNRVNEFKEIISEFFSDPMQIKMDPLNSVRNRADTMRKKVIHALRS